MPEKFVGERLNDADDSAEQLGDLLQRSATPWQRRVAGLAALSIVLVSLLAVRYGGQALPHLQVYLPITITLIVLCEAVTGYLLLSQYVISRQPVLLVLGLAYLFGALMAASYLLAFPGVFAPYNPFDTSMRTPGWIWVFWVCGYACWIFAAVLVMRRGSHSSAQTQTHGHRRRWPWLLLLPLSLAGILVCIAVQAVDWLPVKLNSSGQLTLPLGAFQLVGLVNGLALVAAFWRGNLRRVFDLFLLVSVLAMFGYALLGIASLVRFSLTWYMAGVLRTIASGGLLVALLWEVGRLYRELQSAHQQLTRASERDGLTGIYNRGYLDKMLDHEFRRAQRSDLPLSVILLDVDHFKAYNDSYGHQQGDICLRAIAKALNSICQRSGDFAARYGGEEFMLVFPGIDCASAQRLAEQARQAVLVLKLPAAAEHGGFVSISSGVACHVRERAYDRLEALIEASDTALYQAKSDGRNRVVVATSPDVLLPAQIAQP